MIYFFGILDPGGKSRKRSDEAPAKRPVFGGLPDISFGAVPMSRLEQDACYFRGAAPEPEADSRHGRSERP